MSRKYALLITFEGSEEDQELAADVVNSRLSDDIDMYLDDADVEGVSDIHIDTVVLRGNTFTERK